MTTGSVFGVKGKVALVTGASSGLGRASANFLAKAGAKVVGLARRADALEAWRVEAGGSNGSNCGRPWHDAGFRSPCDR
jgi:NADP-dependent 3-hydroxy acid dehydrogenase YdfG